MTKKLRALLSVAMAIGLLASCSDEPSYPKADNVQNESEMLQIAKNVVQECGNVILPVNNLGNNESRSMMSFVAEAVPQWDLIKYYNIDGMQVLMVELKTVDEILSRVVISGNGKTEIQESTTFSRLVIRKKDSSIYAHVLTYMPESNYAALNKEKLDTIGYYPYLIGFTGVTLTSHLDGSIYRGIRYENGDMVGLITTDKSHICTHEHNHDCSCEDCHCADNKENCNCENCECVHEHESEHINRISINLYSSSVLTLSRASKDQCPTCFSDINTDGTCPTCDYWDCPQCLNRTVPKNGGYCTICGYLEVGLCPVCYIPYSVCGHNYDSLCPICGGLKGDCSCIETCPYCGRTSCDCEPEKCSKCGTSPCSCPSPGPNPEPDDPVPVDTCAKCNKVDCICCSACGEATCVCETNNVPVIYVAHDNDILVGELTECESANYGTHMAVLSMAYKIYGEEKTQEELYQYYTEVNAVSPEESTVLDRNNTFMTSQFSMGLTDNLATTAANHAIVVRHNGSYILIIGVQYDGDLIYADPSEGRFMVVNASYFAGDDHIVIYSVAGAKALNLDEQELN